MRSHQVSEADVGQLLRDCSRLHSQMTPGLHFDATTNLKRLLCKDYFRHPPPWGKEHLAQTKDAGSNEESTLDRALCRQTALRDIIDR